MELTTGADKALADAQAAIQQAKTAAGDYLSMDSITAAEEIVAPQLQKLEELSANLTRSVHQNPQARIHIPKVGNAVSMMKMEVQKLRLAKPKAAAAQKLRESEQKDAAALEEALAELKAVMDNAEDMVEKTAITMSLVEQAGDNADETAEAITATEAHAKESSQVLKEATAALATKTAQVVKTLTLPKVKLQANQELDKLRQKLKLAQQKLLPMLNIKQTFKLKAAAEQLMSQVEEQLTSADMQVDEAEKICEALQGDDPGNDVIKEAERAVAGAVDMLNGTARTLEARRAQAGTNPYLKTEQAEERIRGGHKRLEGLRAILKRKQEKQASANLLNDVAEKMQALQDALARALELLGPYLFESAVRSLDETLEDIRNGEKEMIAASKAASAARITISMKQIDVKRFVGESGQEAQRLLKLRQEELEAALKKIEEVKAGMATCKEAALKVEVSTRVEEAEALVLKVEAAMDLVSDESKLEGLSETEIRERGGAAADLKAACDKACKLAQDLVTKRQIDAKARPSADAEEVAELQKFQARVRLATAEASKYKALPAAVQAQLAVKKVIDEAASKVIAAEEKKDKAEKAVRAVLDAVESQEEAPEGLGKAPGADGGDVRCDGVQVCCDAPPGAEGQAAAGRARQTAGAGQGGAAVARRGGGLAEEQLRKDRRPRAPRGDGPAREGRGGGRAEGGEHRRVPAGAGARRRGAARRRGRRHGGLQRRHRRGQQAPGRREDLPRGEEDRGEAVLGGVLEEVPGRAGGHAVPRGGLRPESHGGPRQSGGQEVREGEEGGRGQVQGGAGEDRRLQGGLRPAAGRGGAQGHVRDGPQGVPHPGARAQWGRAGRLQRGSRARRLPGQRGQEGPGRRGGVARVQGPAGRDRRGAEVPRQQGQTDP